MGVKGAYLPHPSAIPHRLFDSDGRTISAEVDGVQEIRFASRIGSDEIVGRSETYLNVFQIPPILKIHLGDDAQGRSGIGRI
ncbi:MAG: hypothetical protein WCK39_07745, partial [Methanomassiliicoccales archaeon]